MDALQFNKAVSRHCKESGGDCCKCDLRLYCYLSPSERPDELVSLVIDFLRNHIENHGHYTHRSAASFPCIDDMTVIRNLIFFTNVHVLMNLVAMIQSCNCFNHIIPLSLYSACRCL